MERLWTYIQPSNSLLILLVIGLVLLWIGWRRTGKTLLILVAIAVLAIITLPISGSLMIALETRFPQPVLPDKVDGIIVLGGSMNPANTELWGQPQLNARVERLTEGAALARRYPEAKLVFTGGYWRGEHALSEADVARQFFLQLGLNEDQLVFENRSGSTFQNARFSQDILAPQPGEVWVLVTSAFHMPRSVGVFRKAGWDIIPYPVDYYTSGRVAFPSVPHLGDGLATFDFVSREWVALAGYYLRGQSSEFFPAPDPKIKAKMIKSGSGSENR